MAFERKRNGQFAKCTPPWNKGLVGYGKGRIVLDETKAKLSAALSGRKFSDETKKKMSNSHSEMIGDKNSFYGKKHTEESKEKNRISTTERWEDSEFRKKVMDARKGKQVKEKNPRWKGGITPLTRKIRECSKNKSWIKSVFCRDDYICQNCSTRGGALEAHHKKEFYIIMKDFLEENRQLCALKDKEVLFELALSYNSFWDVDNGETLCSDCHKRGKEEQYV